MINLCLGSVCLNATDRLAAVATAHGLPLNITRSAFDERFSGWFDRDPHRSQKLKGAPATALASTNRHTMDDILERHGLAHKDLAAPHRIAMGLYVEHAATHAGPAWRKITESRCPDRTRSFVLN